MKRSTVARAAVAGAACALLAQGSAFAANAPIGLTKPIQATKSDVNPGRMYSSPAFAIDPGNPMRVVAGFADLRSRRCGVSRSTDGGQTWKIPEASSALPSYPFCSQAQGGVIQAPVAFGRNGTLYLASGAWDDQDGTRNAGAIVLSRSSNLGDSWEPVLVYNARGKVDAAAENVRPAQGLVVDTSKGNDDIVYVTFNLTKPNAVAPNAEPSRPMVAVSRDGGRTFAPPTDLSEKIFEPQALRDQALTARTTTTVAPGSTTTSTTAPAAGSRAADPNQAVNFGGSAARLGIDGKGTVYALWQSATANVTPAPPAARYLSKSTDGGKTWTTTQTLPFSYDNAGARFAVSKSGVLHMVYGRNPKPELSGYGEVYAQSSTDGGKTWGPPVVLSDDNPAGLFGQFFPNVSVAPNGRVDAVWWDTRDDPGTRSNDVYYSYSNDNGKTWSKNTRITDQLVDRKVGVWGANYDITSPPSVGSTNAFAVFGWDDTRNTDYSNAAYLAGFGSGTQDVYTAVSQFSVVGAGTSKAVKAALAGVVGLLVVGLVLLGVAVAAKRRDPSLAPTTTGDKKPANVS